MKRSKYSDERITYALRQAESGTPVGDVCRKLGQPLRQLQTRGRSMHVGLSTVESPRVDERDPAAREALNYT